MPEKAKAVTYSPLSKRRIAFVIRLLENFTSAWTVAVFSNLQTAVSDWSVPMLSLSPGMTLRPFAFH
jgi:5-methylcytosine-specific restriction endonuclease McrBC regulatory subunit McrC